MRYLTRARISRAAWHRLAVDPGAGGCVEFIGTVRAKEAGRRIEALNYEAYPAMAERMIGRLVGKARARWRLKRVCVRHRVGRVRVGEVAVLIGVQAAHREEAFAACRFLIDAVKADAPIWKRGV